MPHEEATPDRLQQGFTLVEMLVAIMILSFVALGIAGLFSHAVINNASGYDYAQLATEARFAMEQLQSLRFDSDLLAATTGDPHTIASIDPDFNITYTVDEYTIKDWETASGGAWEETVSGTANVKRITMTVASTNPVLEGRRVFTVSTLKIEG